MSEATIGVIGGSGLYEIEGLEDREEVSVETPFGDPSDAYVVGTLEGRRVAFLSRHGRGHRVNPSELNYRANIYGFRSLGVDRLLSVSAVGSLREDVRPRDLLVPDQFLDRTRGRPATFFEDGLVAHISFADPVCPNLAELLVEAISAAGCTGHDGGTYVCIEGPQFSTRAESELYRSWGLDVIGMTNLTEAKLAREAEVCYATLAMVCDYDCWYEGEEDVTAEMVIDNLRQGVADAQDVIRQALRRIGDDPQDGLGCGCRSALENAILTARDRIDPAARERLDLLVGAYLGEGR